MSLNAPLKQKPSDDSPNWRAFFDDTIVPFWDTKVESTYFKGDDGLTLHYASYKHNPEAPLVVISPGRIESALKYQELFWELAQCGYSVTAIDHRGQGLSDRLTDNPHQGHVDSFDDFVRDFARFNDEIEKEFGNVPKTLFSHSMGGTIATLYCANYKHSYRSLILSAPMFSIDTGGVPYSLAKLVVSVGARLNRWFARPWYFLGMKNYQRIAFEDNVLTQSPARYDAFRDGYEAQPSVQLGGPTFNWLYEAIKASEAAQDVVNKINIPVTLFRAGADKVVSKTGQLAVAAKATEGHFTFRTIEGAYHELMMEKDGYRTPVLSAIVEQTLPLLRQSQDPCAQ
ncbi:alpha/beta hydrolase [uncultured Idiomarina sp.]|uniref:alpha/beta hydrolase n=1 Tax=uncultured Idiomarina sp. TaxID=352961 RepID=UPI0025922B67|nr:alpha/beta hydrolase [uncultured Idiomarina sp.]